MKPFQIFSLETGVPLRGSECLFTKASSSFSLLFINEKKGKYVFSFLVTHNKTIVFDLRFIIVGSRYWCVFGV